MASAARQTARIAVGSRATERLVDQQGRFVPKDSKTEQPTARRRKQARDEGQVARSAEVSVMVSLLGAALTARVFLPVAVDTMATETTGMFAHLDPTALGTERLVDAAARMALATVGPFAAVAVVAALAAGFAQVGFKVAPKAARPKLSNLSPKKGFEKFKPSVAGWELVRTLLKLGLLVVAVWGPVTSLQDQIVEVRALDDGIALVAGMLWTLIVRALLLAMVVGGADYAWNRRRTGNQMKMSKDEVRREHKDQEGDPMVKAQRRRRAAELSRNRMLRDVATADVVLVNPTELAIAMRYEPGDPAPRIVAKGADHLAKRIRDEARRNGVPITADKPLCRAMYRSCRVGDLVPTNFFEAVAIVLAWAYRRRGRLPAGSVA